MKTLTEAIIRIRGLFAFPNRISEIVSSKTARNLVMSVLITCVLMSVMIATIFTTNYPLGVPVTIVAVCILALTQTLVTLLAKYNPGLIFIFDREVGSTYGWAPTDNEFARHFFEVTSGIDSNPDTSCITSVRRAMADAICSRVGPYVAASELLDAYKTVLQSIDTPHGYSLEFVNSISAAVAFLDAAPQNSFNIKPVQATMQTMELLRDEFRQIEVVNPANGLKYLAKTKIRQF